MEKLVHCVCVHPSLQNGSMSDSVLLLSQSFTTPFFISSHMAYMRPTTRQTTKFSYQAFSQGTNACPQEDPIIHTVTKENAQGSEASAGNDRTMLDSVDSAPIKTTRSKEVMQKLQRYGIAGVLSYGLFNTVYYLGMFLFVWFYVSPSSGGLGFKAAAGRFIKILALVWAGSQVTKLLRAGCALALAPAVDRCLSWFTNHFQFESRGKAFGVIVAACFSLALIVFLVITYMWA